MKTHLIALLIALTSASLAWAKPPTADEQALLKLENDWTEARLQRDLSRTDGFVDSDWVFINPDGVLIPKKKADENLATGFVSFKSSRVDDTTIRIHGDTAVVSSLVTQSLVIAGNDVNGQFRITDTYVKRDGHWRCIATQVTRFAPRA